jgi:antitoxin (DNA-binding transcriptional repressor) of toxin-antitoxin stability system
MQPKHTVTLKELHEHTGRVVRGAAQSPIQVTDRGKPVAVITHPSNLPVKRGKRKILPEYARILKKPAAADVLEDIDAIRER